MRIGSFKDAAICGREEFTSRTIRALSLDTVDSKAFVAGLAFVAPCEAEASIPLFARCQLPFLNSVLVAVRMFTRFKAPLVKLSPHPAGGSVVAPLR